MRYELRLLFLLVFVCAIFSLFGCATGDFQKLLEDVKENCHTTIDAQIATTISGVGGSGHFQQECWPTGLAAAAHSAPPVATPAP